MNSEVAGAIARLTVRCIDQRSRMDIEMIVDAFDDRIDALDKCETECDRLRDALTPSVETKAAYMGEFEFRPDEDMEKIFVPWVTIKQIMKAIRERAALQDAEG